MVVIGGEGEVDLNDLWVLNLDTKQWRQLSYDGDAFTPRRFHTAVTHGRKVFIFGGCEDDY